MTTKLQEKVAVVTGGTVRSFRFSPERKALTTPTYAAKSACHEQRLRKNNLAGNSHQPTRRRERKMQRFKSPDQPTILVCSRRRLQHVQRPAPSHFAGMSCYPAA